MRTRILGLLTGLTLLGTGAAVAKEDTKARQQTQQQQQQQDGQQQDGQPQARQDPETQDLQPLLGRGPEGQSVEVEEDAEEERRSISVGPMMYGNQSAPADEGINQAPGSSAGGYTSASPYAAPSISHGQGSADVTVEEGQGIGGAGQQGQQGEAAAGEAQAESSLTGTVVKAERSRVFLRTDEGAVVPLKVDRQTQFGDEAMKSAKSLQEGQQVRASFRVEKTDNLATRLEVTGEGQGIGGAGTRDDKAGGEQKAGQKR